MKVTTNTKAKPKTKRSVVALTKETILDTPESDYMSAAQLDFFRALLTEEYKQLVGLASETLVHLQDNQSISDISDRATQEEERGLELRVRDRERKLLRKVQAALVRIEEGTYGWCKETGAAIGLPRLLARPTADLCVEAQQRHEHLEHISS